MFESAALGRKYSKEAFAAVEADLRVKLFNAQRLALKHKLPVLVTIAGVDGSGRGGVVNMLAEWMDAKGMQTHTFWLKTDEESAKPEAWRFWRCLPGAGEIGVFMGGWYGEPIRKFCTDAIRAQEFDRLMHRAVRLEHALAASGTVIVKLWLHLSGEEHKKRLKVRLKNKGAHHFTPYEKKSAENYDGLIDAAGKAITMTDRVDAPWTLIDACDANFRNASVARAIIEAIEGAVARKIAREAVREAERQAVGEAGAVAAEENPVSTEQRITTLDALDLTLTCQHGDYKKALAQLQAEISELTFQAYQKGISSTLIFEGSDAAGKGGAIRRLTAAMDARIFRVIPISAPTDEELAHNYLWRFWRHIPMHGFITIYDRSWYGRVLVERVEKLASEGDWRRAYAELNDFEAQLQEGGNILMKYWLQISSDEQLRRFREREDTPWKQYKITPEDWRNREKQAAYTEAAEEMFARTSTANAPWHVISAEDKKYARITVLRLYRDELKKALKRTR